MRTFLTALSATALVSMAMAAPADAQARRSPPPPGATMRPAPVAAGPTGANEYRPTQVFGVQRAQTLMNDAAVVGIDGSGVAVNFGLNENTEVGFNANLGLNNIGGAFALDLGVGAGGKFRFVNADNLGVAVLAGLGLNKPAAANTLQTSVFAGLPVSFWIGQRGGFHVMPMLAIGPDPANPNQIANTFGTGLAYEMELNPTWRLMIADNISFANNAINNSYRAGVRVGVTPNTTVDVSLINGFLNLGGPLSGAANVTLLNLSAYFGGPTSQVRTSFGL